jgi:VanZ family protein
MINFFSKYKFVFYFCNFLLIFLYLFPGSLFGCFLYNDCQLQPQITPDFIISTNHLYAFFVFSLIGFFTYKKNNHLKFLIIYLILSSVILEMMHYIIPFRSFELSDLFGNLAGVLIVIIINYFFKKYENFKN